MEDVHEPPPDAAPGPPPDEAPMPDDVPEPPPEEDPLSGLPLDEEEPPVATPPPGSGSVPSSVALWPQVARSVTHPSATAAARSVDLLVATSS
ncbi:hypothetical protein BE17_03250 [Sorangium cellulosum]|uniref:Uncharacterized protein n=1 Tax=Sorangium cellulosum TaxID=56 RepID=A0A150R3U8_SORCE|nr:hypothetical protein BE17_03250 [Sorangium cellulosum]